MAEQSGLPEPSKNVAANFLNFCSLARKTQSMNISLLGTICRIHLYIIVPEGFRDNAFYDLNSVEIGLERQVEIGNN